MIAIVALPALSWLDGSGQLAWTMFSRTGSFRIRIVAIDRAGNRSTVAPTSLAKTASVVGGARLSGSEQWRFHDVARATLHRHVDDLARHACELVPAARVEIRFEERADLDDAPHVLTAERRCAR